MFVLGKIAGDRAAQRALSVGEKGHTDLNQVSEELERLRKLASAKGSDNLRELQKSLKTIMWNQAGIVRNEKSLNKALEEIFSLKKRFRKIHVGSYGELTSAIKLNNMLVVSEMVVRSALLRNESRGAHYRSDYPDENNEDWLKNIVISKKNEEMILSTISVDLSRMAP